MSKQSRIILNSINFYLARMRKILPALVLILVGAACKKKKTFDTYQKSYYVQYYQNADSYVAMAGFTKSDAYTGSPLNEDESVTFNGLHYAELKDNIYYWYGKGKPEASFVLIQGEGQLSNSMPLSEVGDYEIICPDTVSRAEKIAFRIKGIDEQHTVTLQIVKPGEEDGMGVGIQGDSCYISLYELQHFYDDGEHFIHLQRRIVKEIPPMEQPGTGRIEYYLTLKKPLYFRP